MEFKFPGRLKSMYPIDLYQLRQVERFHKRIPSPLASASPSYGETNSVNAL